MTARRETAQRADGTESEHGCPADRCGSAAASGRRRFSQSGHVCPELYDRLVQRPHAVVNSAADVVVVAELVEEARWVGWRRWTGFHTPQSPKVGWGVRGRSGQADVSLCASLETQSSSARGRSQGVKRRLLVGRGHHWVADGVLIRGGAQALSILLQDGSAVAVWRGFGCHGCGALLGKGVTQIGKILGWDPSGLAKPGSRSSCCGGALCVAATPCTRGYSSRD